MKHQWSLFMSKHMFLQVVVYSIVLALFLSMSTVIVAATTVDSSWVHSYVLAKELPRTVTHQHCSWVCSYTKLCTYLSAVIAAVLFDVGGHNLARMYIIIKGWIVWSFRIIYAVFIEIFNILRTVFYVQLATLPYPCLFGHLVSVIH